MIELIKKSYRQLFPVPEFIHQQISRYYREYLVVGGMPEAVQTFVTKTDFNEVVKVQRSIMTTYRADITSYAGKMAPLVKRVFDAMPSALGKQDKRFVLSDIEKGASLRKYEDPTQWLIDAGIAYYSFNTNAFELPFEATENRRLYKLYMVDTGLLCSQLLKKMQFSVMNGEIDINEGALTENFVACALAANEVALHYYDKKSKLELDFVIPDENGITIIEVKSGAEYKKHASLNNAIASNAMKIDRSIVLSANNVEVDNGIIYLPLYMASLLELFPDFITFLRHLVIVRVSQPGSKLATVDYLKSYYDEDIDLNHIYRYMDKLYNTQMELAQQISVEHTRKLFGGSHQERECKREAMNSIIGEGI